MVLAFTASSEDQDHVLYDQEIQNQGQYLQ